MAPSADLAATLWAQLDGEPAIGSRLTISGDEVVLPSVFDVTGLAAASVGVATLAAAEVLAARNGSAPADVSVDTRESSAAFVCERLFEPIGWTVLPLWDPIAGDYRARDGWIRLHTNYPAHRAATLRALGLRDADRDEVAAAVEPHEAVVLEQRVVDEGGCAAAMHTQVQWRSHPHGSATVDERPVATERVDVADGGPARLEPASRPLDGVRVLDLTRVIAGPVCTRFLAAWGADVLRVDPPGFEEVPALGPETSAGKHCTFLDLHSHEGRAVFAALAAQADVIVHGLRPGALDGLGLDARSLHAANPVCVVAALDAYGWTGPWWRRRGFDSLVQMSCGIAAAGAAAIGVDRPTPLPAQALDHATGFLTAAAICRALALRHRLGEVREVRTSLVGTANLLVKYETPDGLAVGQPRWTTGDTEPRATEWGDARAAAVPGRIGDLRPRLALPAGPLGRHDPEFSTRP